MRADQGRRADVRRGRIWLVGAIATLAALAGSAATGPRFYPDDPLVRYPETQDASAVTEREASSGYDFIENSFLHPGERDDRRAANLNTVDEVPDSSWFTNRILALPLSIDELARGPDRSNGPVGPFRIRAGKTAGATPGFRMRDARNDLYFVKFDPIPYLELATAAEVISTKLLHAAGYYVPENYILTLRREELGIEDATVTGPNQRQRPMTRADLDLLLRRAGRQADGAYRVLASKALPGTPVGPFRYYGTRADDPNDLVPHEHRRELRGFRVFAAWINHADSRGINSLDTLVEEDGRHRVRHNLLDFGSTLGSAGTQAKSPRSGHETLWDVKQSLLRILTLGVIVPDWARVRYPDVPSVGRFDAASFNPARWVPHYPNPAFDNARADDTFWAARRVMAFSDDAIRTIVGTGQLSDPEAEAYLAETLIARRDKIGQVWLTGVNPLVDIVLGDAGRLTFTNAAVALGVATPPTAYRTRWSVFDNDADRITGPIVSVDATAPVLGAPASLLRGDPAFLRVDIESVHPDYPDWSRPVRVYVRRSTLGWRTVGIERDDLEGQER